MDKKEYIKILTDQIRCKIARPAVAREIGDHIEDQTRAFVSEGMNQAEAEAAAVKEMGNPVETGVELDRIHRPKMPWLMIGLIVILSGASCVFQFLLNQEAVTAGAGSFYDSRRQIIFTVLGLLVMIGVCFADYTRIAARARELLSGLILIIVLGRMSMGLTLNGAERWIALPGGLSVDVLLLLMLTVPLYGAVLYGYRGKGWSAIWKGVLWMVPGCWLATQCSSVWMASGVSGMPELSDFMLCSVAGYYGILAAVILAGVLLFLLLRFLQISIRQRNQLGMMMGTGCAVVFLIEAGFYFLNNLGIIYLGNYCPFFSYGGTGTIVTYILMGILLSICRYQNVAPERKTAGPLFGIRRPAERMKEQI